MMRILLILALLGLTASASAAQQAQATVPTLDVAKACLLQNEGMKHMEADSRGLASAEQALFRQDLETLQEMHPFVCGPKAAKDLHTCAAIGLSEQVLRALDARLANAPRRSTVSAQAPALLRQAYDAQCVGKEEEFMEQVMQIVFRDNPAFLQSRLKPPTSPQRP